MIDRNIKKCYVFDKNVTSRIAKFNKSIENLNHQEQTDLETLLLIKKELNENKSFFLISQTVLENMSPIFSTHEMKIEKNTDKIKQYIEEEIFELEKFFGKSEYIDFNKNELTNIYMRKNILAERELQISLNIQFLQYTIPLIYPNSNEYDNNDLKNKGEHIAQSIIDKANQLKSNGVQKVSEVLIISSILGLFKYKSKNNSSCFQKIFKPTQLKEEKLQKNHKTKEEIYYNSFCDLQYIVDYDSTFRELFKEHVKTVYTTFDNSLKEIMDELFYFNIAKVKLKSSVIDELINKYQIPKSILQQLTISSR